MIRATYPSLSGRYVLITGGATGIGAALVRAFVAQSAQAHFITAGDSAMITGQQFVIDAGRV